MEFPLAKFRVLYNEFDGIDDDVVLTVAELGECYLPNCKRGVVRQAWMLIVAHILVLRARQAANEAQPGVVTSASIDRVSVSFSSPPSGDSTDHWLNLTAYGQEFLALSNECSDDAPFYTGGRPERAAFRSVGGRFPRGGRSW